MRALSNAEIGNVGGQGLGRIIVKGLEYLGLADAASEIGEAFVEGFKEGYEREKNR